MFFPNFKPSKFTHDEAQIIALPQYSSIFVLKLIILKWCQQERQDKNPEIDLP